MTLTDALLIAATATSPLVAVQVQKFLERLNVRKGAQLHVFKVLMATRATRVSPDHVQALNMISLEYRGPSAKEKEVVKQWRIYADHLNEKVSDGDKMAIRGWVERSDELFIDLLEALARANNYDVDRVELKRGIYYPRAHDEQEQRRLKFEEAICQVLTGEVPLAMRVVDLPVNPDAIEQQLQLQAALLRAIGDGTLRVMVEQAPPLVKVA